MHYIGLTGSIGSGKTTVLTMFKDLGAATLSADEISRELTRTPAIIHRIITHFGPEYQLSDGQLNRAKLRVLIIKDHHAKTWLEALLHPLIRNTILDKLKSIRAPYVVIEIPLLYNRKDYPQLTRILTVEAPAVVQIKRVIKRDGCPLDVAKNLLEAQASPTFRLKIADDIIHNDKDLETLRTAVKKLHESYL